MAKSVLPELAHLRGIAGEVPNKELAIKLIRTKNRAGIREIAANIWHQDKRIQANCLKVLSEIGMREPKLVTFCVDDMFPMLASRNNRLVWGAMQVISAVAPVAPKAVFAGRARIMKALTTGSVITTDHGILSLAIVASKGAAFSKVLFPYLMRDLQSCRSQDVARHATYIFRAVNPRTRDAYLAALGARLPDMPEPRASRVRRLMRVAGA